MSVTDLPADLKQLVSQTNASGFLLPPAEQQKYRAEDRDKYRRLHRNSQKPRRRGERMDGGIGIVGQHG